MSHIDDGLLHAYLDGALHAEDPAEAERVERHLAVCDDCRARLETAQRLRMEADLLLEAATPAELDMPPFEVIAARAASTDTSPNGDAGANTRIANRRRRLNVTRTLAWAASIVLALGMGWWARELAFQPGGLPQAPANLHERTPAASDALEAATPAPAADHAMQSSQPAPEREEQTSRQAAGATAFSGKTANPTTASEPQAGAAAPRQAAAGPPPASEPPKAAAQSPNAAAQPSNTATQPSNTATQPSSAAAERLNALAAEARARAPDTTSSAIPTAPSLATGAQAKAMVEAAPSVAADAAMRKMNAVTMRVGPLTLEQARAWLGGPIYGVRGLEVVSVAASNAPGSTRAVTVTQRLSVTETLSLHQLRPANGNAFTLGPGSTGVIRDGTLIYARTALPPDSLQVLLRRLVPLGN